MFYEIARVFMAIGFAFVRLDDVAVDVIHWIAALTVGQIVKALFWTVTGPALVALAVGVLIVFYLPIGLVALVYNRTYARAHRLQPWRPYWVGDDVEYPVAA